MLDYLILIITLIFVIFSIWKGFIQSILGLMTWIGSIIITLIFYEKLSIYLSSKLNQINFFENYGFSEIISMIISIPLIFVISLIVLRKIKKLITSDLDKATLGIIIDKIFGIIYGLLFSYFIFSIIIFIMSKINIDLTFYFVKSSIILTIINDINNIYILNQIPFISESIQDSNIIYMD